MRAAWPCVTGGFPMGICTRWMGAMPRIAAALVSLAAHGDAAKLPEADQMVKH